MALRVWSQMRNIIIEKIRKNRKRIIKVCKEVRGIKIAGSATSIAGGVLTILGLGLTPVTLGGSIAISVVGGSIALAGGAASVSATVFNKIMSKSKLRKVQDIFEVDQQLCQIIEILEENLQIIAEDIQRDHPDKDKKDIIVALLHGSKLVQITSIVTKGGVAGSQVARIGGTTAIQGGLFAFRLGSTAVRGVAIAGGIVSLLILPFDIYELTTNAYKVHKHSESKSACMQWLNEQLEKLTTQKQEIESYLEEIERGKSESTSSYSTEV